ncbi:hypothetical protein P167DRAFT_438632 [Morchella conica CCBAS932]|uniref:Uncharacterized protein n=1 Tax=Morchella conica CCBAS932 TaxID=1392247 RepID=A0A3N4K910_9PEZI|nr:hypothetical protein P167DRAFT_438632 [Morchella conica CCBAS932]
MSLYILYSMVSSFVVILNSKLVDAAPLPIFGNAGNTTEPAGSSFVPSPRGRGTLDIFFTCTITLMLCVWTAVHPNIVTNPTVARCLKHRVTYMVLGLVIPECVLGIAINEWREARKVLHAWKYSMAIAHAKEAAGLATEALKRTVISPSDIARQQLKEATDVAQRAGIADPATPGAADTALPAVKAVKEKLKDYEALERIIRAREVSWVLEIFRRGVEKLRKSLPISNIFLRETPFGMEGAFFAVMGGYTFCPLDRYEHPEYQRTLSADAMVLLLRMGIVDGKGLASLKNEVKDKGKANVLAKFLVCAQALWMVMNCFLRRAAHLPITIIELNVIVHVFCAVIVYACWWKKPHDAGSAISLDGFISKPISAVLFFMQYPDTLELHVSEPRAGDFSITTRIINATNQFTLPPIPLENATQKNGKSGKDGKDRKDGKDGKDGKGEKGGKNEKIEKTEESEKNEESEESEKIEESEKMGPEVTQNPVEGSLHSESPPNDTFDATTAREEHLDESSTPLKPQIDDNGPPKIPDITPDVPLHLTGQVIGQDIPQGAGQGPVHPGSSSIDVIGTIAAGSGQQSRPPTAPVHPPLAKSRPGTASDTQYRLNEIALYREVETWGGTQLRQIDLSDDEKKAWETIGTPPLDSSRIFIDSRRGVTLRADSSVKFNITAQEYRIFVSAAETLRSMDRPKSISNLIVIGNTPYPILLKSPEEMTAAQNSFNLKGLKLMWIPLYLIYGGVHSLLWNTYFPSPTERLLWRISCLLIAFPGLGHFAILVATDQVWRNFDGDTLPDAIYDFAPWYLIVGFLLGWAAGAIYGGIVGFHHVTGLVIQQHYRILIYVALELAVALAVICAAWFLVQVFRGKDWNPYWGFRRYLRWLLVIPMWLLLIAYFLARMFIFVETFICLRSLPIRAYETVIWEEILPHF